MAPLESFGSLGYQVGAFGIVAVTLVYLIIVRWYTDLLGRVLAGVLSSTSLVLIMVALRQLHIDLPGNFFVWRAAVFWMFAASVWSGLSVMVWAQFFAPRLRERSAHRRLTTPQRRNTDEEGHLAASRPGRDGDPDHGSAGER